jgi:hypothetical protein
MLLPLRQTQLHHREKPLLTRSNAGLTGNEKRYQSGFTGVFPEMFRHSFQQVSLPVTFEDNGHLMLIHDLTVNDSSSHTINLPHLGKKSNFLAGITPLAITIFQTEKL